MDEPYTIPAMPNVIIVVGEILLCEDEHKIAFRNKGEIGQLIVTLNINITSVYQMQLSTKLCVCDSKAH